MSQFFDSTLFTWVILPLLIFVARICDMSLDTVRVIMVGRGRKLVAALVGFFEVSLWLLVARQVILHMPNPVCFFAYAAGFSAGNYVGITIEERMAVGYQELQVVVAADDGGRLAETFRRKGYGLTVFSGQGSAGPVQMISTIVPRAAVRDALRLIEEHSPQAFYSIDDVRAVSQGVFPDVRRSRLAGILGFSRRL